MTEGQTKRNYKPRGENQELVDRAIDAIIQHNDEAERHEQKWAITINGLKAWVGSQSAIVDVLAGKKGKEFVVGTRAQEIRDHHAKHQINAEQHNLRHRRKAKSEKVINVG